MRAKNKNFQKNLELNKIYLDDCENIYSKLPKNTVDLTILDPPYNVGAASWDKVENYFEWLTNIIKESVRVTKETGSIYIWGMANKSNDFIRSKLWMDENINKFYFKNWIVWVHEAKIHRRPKDRYLTKHEDLLFYASKKSTFNLVRDDPPPFQLKMHAGRYDENFFIERDKLPPSQQKIFKKGLQLGSPAKSWWKGLANKSAAKIYKGFEGYKSEWVSERIINVSSNENDIVLVPFAGTGTECFCAKKLNRNFIGVERLKKHFDLSIERLKT
ncbi:MAG: hypothetical protein DRO11_04905 [Methanobacteriota archaeon]|nr:MAG: hypothetical protein DRO11_04905 [Euryarchaeota archaeon]